jgi:hypothetical protein
VRRRFHPVEFGARVNGGGGFKQSFILAPLPPTMTGFRAKRDLDTGKSQFPRAARLVRRRTGSEARDARAGGLRV